MSPLAPFQEWTLRAGIVVALVVTLPMLGFRGVAHADLGDEPSKSSSTADQADDADKPKDGSLLEKQPADAVAAKAPPPAVGPPFYEKWQFWVLAVVVTGALVGLGFGLNALFHQMDGGDVRPCNPAFLGCGGEGR
jgi:hypothetical protein